MGGVNDGQRVKHVWVVPIETEDGQTSDEIVKAYWNPEGDTVNEAVQLAACSRISQSGLGAHATGPAVLQT